MLNKIEVVSFATKKVKSNSVSILQSASDGGANFFETETIAVGMLPEPALITDWLNSHVFIQNPMIKDKLTALVDQVEALPPYEQCSKDEQNLMVTMTSIKRYDDSRIIVTETFQPFLHNLKTLGLLNFTISPLASGTNQNSYVYLISFNE